MYSVCVCGWLGLGFNISKPNYKWYTIHVALSSVSLCAIYIILSLHIYKPHSVWLLFFLSWNFLLKKLKIVSYIYPYIYYFCYSLFLSLAQDFYHVIVPLHCKSAGNKFFHLFYIWKSLYFSIIFEIYFHRV